MDSLSVIVTAHNCAAVIEKTLRSVAAALAFYRKETPRASEALAELIVVDDGSTDGTDRMVLEFAKETGIGRLVRRETASSPSCARNAGVSCSAGDVLFFLDGDDLFFPSHLHTCMRALEDPGIDFVKTQVHLADPVHPDWKPIIEASIVINLCIRRRCHEFLGGFPDYHLFERDQGEFRHRTDVFYKIEDQWYNVLAREMFRGKGIRTETAEYFRYPGNSYDRQYEKFRRPYGQYKETRTPDQNFRSRLSNILIRDLQARLGRKRPALAEARRLHKAQAFDRAEQAYREVLRAGPADAEVYYLLGAACDSLGKLEEAETNLRASLARRPHYAPAHNHLGVVLGKRRRPDEAADCFRRALSVQPDSVEFHINLGLALAAQGKPGEAVVHYREALRLEPDNTAARNLLGRALRDQSDLAVWGGAP